MTRTFRVVAIMLVLSNTWLRTADASPLTCFGKLATIVGTPGPDKLVGTPGPDVIVGGRGKDGIKGKGGEDRLCGNRGRDRLHGGKGKDRLAGNRANDYVGGGKGEDRLEGNRGNDNLFGADGDDRLLGAVGRDTLIGSFGDNRQNGGAGTDTAQFSYFASTVDLSAHSATGEGSDDVLMRLENVFCNEGCSEVIGNAKDNRLETKDPITTFRGRGGDDTLVSNNSSVFHGGRGDDVFISRLFALRDPTFYGGNGTDTTRFATEVGMTEDLSSSDYHNVENLIGGRGADTLTGDGGDNSIKARKGSDQLFGGDGADYLDGGQGTNSNDGGAGIDFCINPDADGGALLCESP